MSRRFLDNVRNDLTALLVTGGETPAPALAALLIDTLDSTIQDEAVLSTTTPTPAVPTATTWQNIDPTIYDNTTGGDAVFLKTDIANGRIVTATQAGFSYSVRGLVSFTDLQTNRQIEFSILANGVQVGFIASQIGAGNGRPKSLSFEHVILSAASDTVYTIGLQTADGVNSVEVLSAGLAVVIQPTNNA
jgi:hypothetical protein